MGPPFSPLAGPVAHAQWRTRIATHCRMGCRGAVPGGHVKSHQPRGNRPRSGSDADKTHQSRALQARLDTTVKVTRADEPRCFPLAGGGSIGVQCPPREQRAFPSRNLLATINRSAVVLVLTVPRWQPRRGQQGRDDPKQNLSLPLPRPVFPACRRLLSGMTVALCCQL